MAFGLLYPAIASYARSIAPDGTVVTTQAVMAASFDGLGTSTTGCCDMRGRAGDMRRFET